MIEEKYNELIKRQQDTNTTHHSEITQKEQQGEGSSLKDQVNATKDIEQNNLQLEARHSVDTPNTQLITDHTTHDGDELILDQGDTSSSFPPPSYEEEIIDSLRKKYQSKCKVLFAKLKQIPYDTFNWDKHGNVYLNKSKLEGASFLELLQATFYPVSDKVLLEGAPERMHLPATLYH